MDLSVRTITDESQAAMRNAFAPSGDLEGFQPPGSSGFMYRAGDSVSIASAAGPMDDAQQALHNLPGMLEVQTLLGQGSFAQVWQCTMELDGARSDVAVKVRRRAHHGEGREAELLGRLAHPNLVKAHMTGVEGQLSCFVLELLSGGDLDKLLHHPDNAAVVAALGLRSRILAMCDVMSCVCYLHENDVVHRDLKPGNSLLSAPAVPGQDRLPLIKVADLGLARDVGALMSQHVGTVRYMAPEVMESQEYGPAADVYSSTMLLFELCTGQRPYAHVERLNNPIALTLAVSLGQRPSLDLLPAAPAPAAPALRGLLEACWQEEPARRPGAAAVLEQLRGMAAALEQQP